MNDILVYDIEIKRAVPVPGVPIIKGIDYCDGWEDHANMGVSCIGGYSFKDHACHLWMDDNIHNFMEAVEKHQIICGFNNIGFDNPVIAATLADHDAALKRKYLSYLNEKSYDIKREMADAVQTHYGANGISLERVAVCNMGEKFKKNGNGALAPVLFQKKEYGKLITYCLNDIRITSAILSLILENGELVHPLTNSYKIIRNPFESSPARTHEREK